MPLDFPNTPVLNDTFTSAGKTWQYNGSAWVLVVGAAAIAVGAVTDDKIASGAVIEAKIGTGAVTETKIGASAVTVTKIGTGAVTAPKLSAGTATNNYVLTADSVQTSGMKWSAFIGASSLSGTIASFNQERNASVTAGQKYANGNGSADTYICFPAACKLVAATISASTDINGTAVVRPWLNAAVVGVSTYDMTVSIASPVVSYDFYASPLAIPANQRFAWNCQSSTVTVGTTAITFYVRFD